MTRWRRSREDEEMGSDEKITAAHAEWVRKTVGSNIGKCGSPVEELFLFGLLNHEEFSRSENIYEDYVICEAFADVVPYPASIRVGHWCAEMRSSDGSTWRQVHFFQQVPIVCGAKEYRADFVAVAIGIDHATRFCRDTKIDASNTLLRVVIEIDGHDFHERTKEQASHDKARDRAMTKAGWHVLRFTGSDIYKDADACVLEVFDLFEAKLSEGAK